MAIRQIVLEGDDILRKKAREVEVIDDKIRELIKDMIETMEKYEGIGLAAPQVGILKRIIVYDAGEGPRVVINPVIRSAKGKQKCEEGCLSLPEMFGIVERPLKLTLEGLDENGKKIKINAHDLEAVVISHETDHLNGVLFIDTAYNIHKGEIDNSDD